MKGITKNFKRRFVYILIGILGIIILSQLYFFIQNKGNLIIYIQNESKAKDSIHLEVSVDNQVVINESFEGNKVFPRIFSFRIKPGYHQIEIDNDEFGISVSETFTLIPIKWIVIGLFDEDIDESGKQEIHLSLDHQLLPPVIQ